MDDCLDLCDFGALLPFLISISAKMITTPTAIIAPITIPAMAPPYIPALVVGVSTNPSPCRSFMLVAVRLICVLISLYPIGYPETARV